MSCSPRDSEGQLDYRDPLIEENLKKISQVILITGGKGGVGKSLIASTAALLLSRSSNRTGLLDLDLHGPSSCLLLGVEGRPVESGEGLVPPVVEGVKVMSIDLFSRGRPLPLTGRAKEEIVKEMLALTSYGRLDYLLVDLPPGTGDELLTAAKYVKSNGRALVVTTPTHLAVNVAGRLIDILNSVSLKIIGLVENMSISDLQSPSRELARAKGVAFLGGIPLDPLLNSRGGSLERCELLSTRFAEALKQVLRNAGLRV
ncbi:Iron-sulfur cluster carrier protein [Candidatus Calditenuaceae archaeon HR02]|nr:Iron-sulfur cluster carrier protein [Candidatus Calditenuaceae archaeon HR02]